MEIRLSGEYSDEDLQRSLALMTGRTFRYLAIALVVVMVFAVVPTVISIISMEAGVLDVLGAVAPVIFILGFLAVVVWWTPRRQAKRLRQALLFQGPVHGLVTDEGLTMGSQHSEGTVRWGAFVQYKMSDQVVLLYQNQAAAQLVPRSLFASDEDWQQFRQFVQATVPEQAKAQGGIWRWRWPLYLFLVLVLIGLALFTLLSGR